MDNDKTGQLKSLASLFSANISQYKSGQYDEANTRTDFVDKFFSLLDWDIANSRGFSESYREVVREDKVKIEGSQKAPDYSFRIGGVRKFFVEAKKPSVNIRDAAEPAYQELPVSIQNHLKENRRVLKNRADKIRRPSAPWWNYTFAMHKEYYHLPKLYCSRRAFGNTFCYDAGFDCLGFSNMTVIFGTNEDLKIKYILALLNSKLLTFRYRSIGKQTGGGSFEYFPNGVGKLPIVKADEKTQNKIILLVDKILELKQKEAAEPNQQLKTMITRQIEGVDSAIDKTVYELYGLSEDEIKAVERGMNDK